MEELGVRPSVAVVNMVGEVFQKLDMLDKYKKLKKKYPPPKWEYKYIKGKRVRIRANGSDETTVNAYTHSRIQNDGSGEAVNADTRVQDDASDDNSSEDNIKYVETQQELEEQLDQW